MVALVVNQEPQAMDLLAVPVEVVVEVVQARLIQVVAVLVEQETHPQ